MAGVFDGEIGPENESAIGSAILAEFAIRQLHARYAEAVFRKDAEAFAACWHEQAEWHIAGCHAVGRQAIAELFARLIGPSRRVLMQAGAPLLAFGGPEITGRVHVTELVKRDEGEALRTIGVYDDRYRGQGTDWHFAERRWMLFYRGPVDLSGDLLDPPGYGPPLGS